jgi:hypothetical protein
MGSKAQHAAAQKKGEMRSWSRQISTHARTKMIRFMERYALRTLTERKIIGSSEIKQPPLAKRRNRRRRQT